MISLNLFEFTIYCKHYFKKPAKNDDHFSIFFFLYKELIELCRVKAQLLELKQNFGPQSSPIMGTKDW